MPQWVIDNQRKREEFERNSDKRPPADLRRAENEARSTARLPRDPEPKLSAEDRRKLKALRAPNPIDLETYRDFLKQDGTGIFRLFPEFGCQPTKGVIKVDGDCANQVEGGSSHAFRGGNSPDLFFSKQVLGSTGFFSQNLMASFGDVSLEDLSAKSRELKFFAAFLPGRTASEAKAQSVELTKGIEHEGIRYSRSVKPLLNTTFALRIIAYRNGNDINRRIMEAGRTGKTPPYVFLQLVSDKRIDLLVAFRIIREDEDGSVSILWKEISRQNAPTIKFADNEEMTDLQ